VKAGSNAKVIDLSFAMKRVRILEGEKADLAGWLPYEYVRQSDALSGRQPVNRGSRSSGRALLVAGQLLQASNRGRVIGPTALTHPLHGFVRDSPCEFIDATCTWLTHIL
jgi:hypothetical protein